MHFRISLLALCLGAVALTARAEQFDGLYAPTGMPWSCDIQDVGMDGGALQIDGTRMTGVETYCRLSRPTQVRGMDAVLYDATCASEGMDYSFRVMLLKKPNGVYVVRPDGIAEWSLCP